jgi:ABC-type transport system substrate-binding protein
VLRVPFLIAETNFDPAATSDQYSHNIIHEIFEPPLTYDFLAQPAKLKPETAQAMPEITDGGRTYTIRLRKGIYFGDDPAFEGRKRELVAADYDFAIKRLLDPKIASPNLWLVEGRIVGVEAAMEKAKKAGRFDYDAPIPGIEVLDRYTLRIRLQKPDYNFLYILTMANLGAQAREVVEKYGGDIGAHPVGTGPFRLAEWKRSSRIVLEKNPNFRETYYDAELPPEDDVLGRKLHAEMKGKRLPQLDRIEVSIIEESQPRWLAFLNDELDWINLPYEFKSMALPDGKPAAWLAKRGVRYIPSVDPDITYLYFNMKDPTFGGYTPEKVALRRAISLAYSNEDEVYLIRNGTALEAQTLIPPGVLGYDPKFSIGKTYDPAKANAMATAGATCPTAARSSSSTPRRRTSSRASSRSCGRRTWTRSACA